MVYLKPRGGGLVAEPGSFYSRLCLSLSASPAAALFCLHNTLARRQPRSAELQGGGWRAACPWSLGQSPDSRICCPHCATPTVTRTLGHSAALMGMSPEEAWVDHTHQPQAQPVPRTEPAVAAGGACSPPTCQPEWAVPFARSRRVAEPGVGLCVPEHFRPAAPPGRTPFSHPHPPHPTPVSLLPKDYIFIQGFCM